MLGHAASSVQRNFDLVLRIAACGGNKHLGKQFGLSRGKMSQTKEMNEWRLD